jgi:hypothetical protein
MPRAKQQVGRDRNPFPILSSVVRTSGLRDRRPRMSPIPFSNRRLAFS